MRARDPIVGGEIAADGNAALEKAYVNSYDLIVLDLPDPVGPAEQLYEEAFFRDCKRALAPGAEEFLPPGESGIWLPPQRTFSSLNPDHLFRAERALGTTAAVEHDLGGSRRVCGLHGRIDGVRPRGAEGRQDAGAALVVRRRCGQTLAAGLARRIAG